MQQQQQEETHLLLSRMTPRCSKNRRAGAEACDRLRYRLRPRGKTRRGSCTYRGKRRERQWSQRRTQPRPCTLETCFFSRDADANCSRSRLHRWGKRNRTSPSFQTGKKYILTAECYVIVVVMGGAILNIKKKCFFGKKIYFMK